MPETSANKICYTFESHHSILRLHTFLALLISHPAQRVQQQYDMIEGMEITLDVLSTLRPVDYDANVEEEEEEAGERGDENESGVGEMDKDKGGVTEGEKKEDMSASKVGSTNQIQSEPAAPPPPPVTVVR